MLWVLVAVLAFALLVAIGYCISVTRERDDFQGLYDAKCRERQDTQYALDDTQKQLDEALENARISRLSSDRQYNSAQHEKRMKSEAQQSLAVERKQKASLLEDLSIVRGELASLRENYNIGKTQYERAKSERDAYKRGLIDVTNLGTRKMAHIGKRMVAAANEALKTGAEL